ncbi:MSPD2 protein, partial [Mystacornis crossleyi]|nr:MSPD2 protein [Mystacornis crossleyi]
DKSDKYDSRDVERLQQDDKWVENYLIWRHDVVDDTLKMIDESFQWRKEYTVNDLSESVLPKWLFEIGALFLHGYDKEGYKLCKFYRIDYFQSLIITLTWISEFFSRACLTCVFHCCGHPVYHFYHWYVRDNSNSSWLVPPVQVTRIDAVIEWSVKLALLIPGFHQNNGSIPLLSDTQHITSAVYLHPNLLLSLLYNYKQKIAVFVLFIQLISYKVLYSFHSHTSNLHELNSLHVFSLCRVGSILFSWRCGQVFCMICCKDNLKKLIVLKFPISPAEELHFGSKETGEKKCLIVLTNVTKNVVAFKVRTTAPEKYRVKPSNSSCEPGTSLDIIVSLHGGFAASLQDRFLIMAAEMDQSSGAGVPELTQFWKEVPRTKVMEHR